MMNYAEASALVLEECRTALSRIEERQTEEFIERITGARKVFCVGVGRVKLSLEAFAKRMCHFGIDIHIVGDITEPAMSEEDVLIVGSGSGSSIIPVGIAQKAKSLGGTIIHIGSNPNSPLAPIPDLMVRIPVQTKLYLADEIRSQQPMSSLFEQTLFLWGDTVACLIAQRRHMVGKELWQYHANLE